MPNWGTWGELTPEENAREVDRIVFKIRKLLTEEGIDLQPKNFCRVELVNPERWRSELKVIIQFVPKNYSVSCKIENGKPSFFLVSGYDEDGLTMDEFVIPRLRSRMLSVRRTYSLGSISSEGRPGREEENEGV